MKQAPGLHYSYTNTSIPLASADNSDIMPDYRYSPLLQPQSIRLLQLLPRKEDPRNLRCKLCEYPLRNSNDLSHPYEAISYVWGSEEKLKSIIIDGRDLSITQNLYVLLLRLQYHSYSRILWVDALCINQKDDKEKENQILLMAEIYAKASHVLVWLGEAEDDGDRALEAIRLTGENSARSNTELAPKAFQQLLKRPWFGRIWVRN
jgi:hypothetical protein